MRQEIIDKLELLEEYITRLKDLQQYSLEEVEKNYMLRGAVERYLQVSLECMLDIGKIIISEEKIKRPHLYSVKDFELLISISTEKLKSKCLLFKLKSISDSSFAFDE